MDRCANGRKLHGGCAWWQRLRRCLGGSLQRLSASNGWGPYEKDTNNGEDHPGDGGPIVIEGQSFSKGIGTHATADLTYSVPGSSCSVLAQVGIDDAKGSAGQVRFEVYDGATLLWSSPTKTGSDPATAMDVDLSGLSSVRLFVDPLGSINSDWADWGDLRFECGGTGGGGGGAPSTTYLSDLTPTNDPPPNGWGPYERDTSNGENQGGDGNTITIDGVSYPKGLGVHALSDVRYDVASVGSACTFHAVVGVDDEVGTNGTIVFEVKVDGVTQYVSSTLTGTGVGVPVSVSVAGANELQLIVSDGGDGISYDHGDWAQARLECGGSGGGSGGETVTSYYQLGGEMVALRRNGEVVFLGTDHLGSTVGTFNATTSNSESFRYYPFGQQRGPVPGVTDHTYTGQIADSSTGLMFYNARYYDPTLGRFISPDTIVPDFTNPQDLNRYSYVRNNPVNLTDPSGHCPPNRAGLCGLGEIPEDEIGQSQYTADLQAYYQFQLEQERLRSRGGGSAGDLFRGFVDVVILDSTEFVIDSLDQVVPLDLPDDLGRLGPVGDNRTAYDFGSGAGVATELALGAKGAVTAIRKAPDAWRAIRSLFGGRKRIAPRSLARAESAADFARLTRQLQFDEAAAVFNRSGGLQPSVINNSTPIVRGPQIGNQQVVKALTADGSNIADWAKYTTQSFQSPSGPFQVHFYRNSVTGAVNYGYDYKVVFKGRR